MKTVKIISIWSNVGRGPKEFELQVEEPQGEYNAEAVLEEAFAITNHPNTHLPEGICSPTAGDIFQLDGLSYLVESQGFHVLTAAEVENIIKLDSRDTSMGYEWMRKHNNI